jgi:hypothetical protein
MLFFYSIKFNIRCGFFEIATCFFGFFFAKDLDNADFQFANRRFFNR